jgi:YkoY family integral membrane protein
MHPAFSDLATVGLLVLLEALLSGDNALVLAVLVLPLPQEQQKNALRYGIVGAFAFRVVATVFAIHLIAWDWVKVLGAFYLLYLPVKHFWLHRGDPGAGGAPHAAGRLLGLSVFWSTVVRVELTDFVFAIDSILVAVAMSRKLWVVLSGGILGIIAMRILVGQLLGAVRRYPAVVDGAYVIVAWVGLRLLTEFLHGQHWLPFSIPEWVSISGSLVLFAGAVLYARARHRAEAAESARSDAPASGRDETVPPPPEVRSS